MMMLATSRAPANRVALPQYSQMIWGVVLSYVIFHQALDKWTCVGIIVLMFSGVLNWIRQKIRYEAMLIKKRQRRKIIHRGDDIVGRIPSD